MEEKRVRKHCTKRTQNVIAVKEQENRSGDYFCDYSPRYEEPFCIYEKAKMHIKKEKKKMKKVVDNEK